MEPPAKRARTGPSPLCQQQNDEVDELNYEPEEVSQMRDPGYQFEQSRAFAAFKLKSTFEHIFQKYERDFTGIGDEIDLRTGQIITNNGHLERMRNERDTGIPDEEDEEDEGMLLEDAFATDDEDEQSDVDPEEVDGNPDRSGDEEDEERILHEKKSDSSHGLPSASKPVSGQSLSSLTSSSKPRPGLSNTPADVWGSEPEPVDPAWKAPEIQQPRSGDSFMSKLPGARYRFPVTNGVQSVWSSRPDSEAERTMPEPARIDMAMLARAKLDSSRVPRPTSMKLLQAFASEDDNEDDILGVSLADPVSSAEKKKQQVGAKKPATETPDQKAPTGQSLSSVENEHGHAEPAKIDGPDEGPQQNETLQTPSKKPQQRKKRAKPQQSDEAPRTTDIEVEPETEDVSVPVGSVSELSVIITEKEARERPRHRLVIELFSKARPRDDISEVEDPADIETFAATEKLQVQKVADETASTIASNNSVSHDTQHEVPPNGSSVPVHPESTGDISAKKVPKPPKETFKRHEIDPSYDFSDDEEGIPYTRVGTSHTREAISLPEKGNPYTQAMFQCFEEPETPAPEGPEENRPVPLEPAISGGNTEEAEAVGDQQQIEEDLRLAISTGIVDDALKELGNMAIDTNQGLQADVPIETIERPVSSSSTPEEIMEDQPIVQETLESVSEDQEAGPTPRPDVAPDTSTPSPRHSSPIAPQVSIRSESRQEDEDQGFVVPLGSDDDVEAASASESEPENEPRNEEPEAEAEAMDLELPTLPAPAEDAANEVSSADGPRHGRPSTGRSRRVQREVISPMRNLNLQSSSPLKRRTNGSIKPRGSVKSSKITARKARNTEPKPPQHDTQAASPQNVDDTEVPPPPSTTTALPRSPKVSSSMPAAKTPSTRRSFVSLLPGDDKDELTLDLFRSWTNGSGGSSAGRKRTSYAPVLLAGPETKISTPMKQRAYDVGNGSGTGTGRGKKRRAAWAFAATPTKVQFGSPSRSLVRTPGGHMRRCGEDGFRCDRDFCFTCL
ncbi:hypothetical protein CPLU01_06128 [Colletotrichum plurivorum]|uniref:Centromere protein Scm3 n=1 Tax=Colletotrichum plurivorum TaxID=2175906 RepID=A0A8H6NH73_9PEZI|nr:hypothetical protein CPLU01_06128 [Colletotrichum plurivorum]